jgi:hypothetical protein
MVHGGCGWSVGPYWSARQCDVDMWLDNVIYAVIMQSVVIIKCQCGWTM